MDSNGQTNGNIEDNLEKGVPDVSFEGVKLSIDSNNLLDENNTGIQGEGAATPVDNAKFQPNAINSSGFYFASQVGFEDSYWILKILFIKNLHTGGL